MNDETLKKVRVIQEDSSGDVFVQDCFSTDEKQKTLGVVEKAQKLEHEERRMRLEESKQKLEAEKFEYQKKQNKRDNLTKVGLGVLSFLGVTIPVFLKLRRMDKAIDTTLKLEGHGDIISSQTARTFMKEEVNPRI